MEIGRIIGLIIGLALVIWTAYIASSKNRNVVLWVFLGLFVPIVSLIIVALLPQKAVPPIRSSALSIK